MDRPPCLPACSMTLAPLLSAPLAIQVHAAAAMASVALVVAMWLRRKGDRLHRWLGRAWVGLMALTALSSFFVTSLRDGRFSVIHLLSVVTLAGLVLLVRRIRQGNVPMHRRSARALSLFALGLAGAFTLLPGRIMHAVLLAGW